MYSSYIKEVVAGLIRSGFHEIQVKDMPKWELPPLLFAKAESPVFYMVSILDSSVMEREEYEKWIAKLTLAWQDTAVEYGCRHAVCLTLLVDNQRIPGTVEYVYNKDFLPGEKLHTIWWYINPQNQTILAAKGHPDKLLNIQSILKEAFLADSLPSNDMLSLEQVKERAAYDALPVAKTSNLLITYALLGINVLIFILMYTSGQQDEWIMAFGVERRAVVMQGEFYRLVTALFLHGSLLHLAQNSIYLYFFGSRNELLFGKGDMLLLYFLSGIGGSIASVFFSGHLAIGASGAVFGLIGSILSYSYCHGKKNIGLNYATLVLLAVVGLLSGFLDTNVDVAAHIGGFLTGMIVAGILLALEKESSPQ
ncbi:MAG: rhomboid family intramembrane serine protease [Epulopiscium sp.]|jgi:membrane associated rhomboid family serine protease|nr:rhomboid family intramembrane serine protease [Candidatus Epulonipiscium sp.]